MAVSKGKLSKNRRGKKTLNNQKMRLPSLVKCKNCGQFKQNHKICACGHYRGKNLLGK